MKIIKVNNHKPDLKVIKKAVDVLKAGGIVVYPTDTAYGLGVDAFNKNAIKKLYGVKCRDILKPTHVVVRDWKMIYKITFPNKYAKILYEKLLPGPLTLILPKKENIPDILTANLPTLGIRIPDNSVTKSLSHLLPFPYTTPSANKSGGRTPYSIDEVLKELDITKVDLILNAGKLPKKSPSTLVDLIKSTPKILREGPIKEKRIKKILQL